MNNVLVLQINAKDSIPLLQLASELAMFAETEGLFLHGFDQDTQGTGHWNKKGHEQVAKLLAARLKRMIEG